MKIFLIANILLLSLGKTLEEAESKNYLEASYS
jgi:hypothetical protein